MKIESGWRPLEQRSRTDQSNKTVATRSFSDVMQQNDQERTAEQLQRKLQDIYNQGERLARSMTVRELKLYQQMVRKFLEDTVKRGVGLKEQRSFDRRGRMKRYKLLDEIDGKLIAMAEELLQSEQGRLELLSSIGEIRGLLINLFF
ncbi:YaaR family protein [Paenibacillus kobensis]|uniref:YaaR family protein n=1 Tax=Paenibacillus kobensis TaxID=59841 RepID=UPI000FDCDB44|nr:YaaR family protein [Paenibacillus kobensis]